MSKVKRPIKLSASSAPGVGDDVADGYSPGWQWLKLSTGDLYVCTSAAAGAAVWVLVNGGGGGGAVASVNTRTGAVVLVGTDIPDFVAAGGSHAKGAVPDPGATAGTTTTTKFLREDATWVAPDAYNRYSIIDWGKLNPVSAPSTTTGNFTVGTEFTLVRPGLVMTGIKFWWASATNRTIRCRLWDVAAGTGVASVDLTTSGTNTLYTATFSSPYTFGSGDLYKNFRVSVWDTLNTGSGIYTYQTDTNGGGTQRLPPSGCLIWPGIVQRTIALSSAGNANPTSIGATERYLVEPVWA